MSYTMGANVSATPLKVAEAVANPAVCLKAALGPDHRFAATREVGRSPTYRVSLDGTVAIQGAADVDRTPFKFANHTNRRDSAPTLVSSFVFFAVKQA